MNLNRKTIDGDVEVGGNTPEDFERLREKALDIADVKANTISEWVGIRVDSHPREKESLTGFKNRLKRLFSD